MPRRSKSDVDRSSDWRRRLTEAMDDSGLSRRSTSLNAGLGPGYVHSVLKEGRDPTLSSFLGVCEALNESPCQILLGVDIRPDEVEFIHAIRRSEAVHDAILTLIRYVPDRD